MTDVRARKIAPLAAKVTLSCAISIISFVTLAPTADARSAGRARDFVTRRANIVTPGIATSQGVALSGADSLHKLGIDGTGVKIVVLDQAFGDQRRLDTLAGSDLPPLDRQHRVSFDGTFGIGPSPTRMKSSFC